MPRNVIEVARNPHLLDPSQEWYGIEVEAEGFTVVQALRSSWSPTFSQHWSFHEDGSLRNGIEFVSAPLNPNSVERAIELMWPKVVPGKAQPSGRTGIHIHASCLGLNTDQVLKIARYYALLEPVLFSIAGASREENIFCIPWYRGDDEARRVYAVLSNDQAGAKHRTQTFVHRRPPTCKYSALNITPLVGLGSIEFRHAPTYDNGDDMLAWYRAVRCVYLTHARHEDPLEFYLSVGPKAFAAAILGEGTADKHVNLDYIEECDVERTARLLYPKKNVVSREWGNPPMLKVKARPPAASPSRTRREPESDLLDEYPADFSGEQEQTIVIDESTAAIPDMETIWRTVTARRPEEAVHTAQPVDPVAAARATLERYRQRSRLRFDELSMDDLIARPAQRTVREPR